MRSSALSIKVVCFRHQWRSMQHKKSRESYASVWVVQRIKIVGIQSIKQQAFKSYEDKFHVPLVVAPLSIIRAHPISAYGNFPNSKRGWGAEPLPPQPSNPTFDNATTEYK